MFELAQGVVNRSAGIISGSLNVGAGTAMDALRVELEAMGVWELIGLWFEMNIIGLCLQAISVCIFLIIFGRMLEIYLTVSVAPIPLSTMVNREWGQMGQNYLKSLFALAFQGFLIMVCVAIYAVLVQSIPPPAASTGPYGKRRDIPSCCVFTLFKTGSLSKSLFSAH